MVTTLRLELRSIVFPVCSRTEILVVKADSDTVLRPLDISSSARQRDDPQLLVSLEKMLEDRGSTASPKSLLPAQSW